MPHTCMEFGVRTAHILNMDDIYLMEKTEKNIAI